MQWIGFGTATIATLTVTSGTGTTTAIFEDSAPTTAILEENFSTLFSGMPRRRPTLQRDPGWTALGAAGKIPVAGELRAGPMPVALPVRPRRCARPAWGASLRAFHRDPGGASREAR